MTAHTEFSFGQSKKMGSPAEAGCPKDTAMLQVAQETLFANGKQRRAVDIVKNGAAHIPAADAALILRECRYGKQTRDLTAAGKLHITVLADLMRREEWRDYEKIDFALVDGKLYIVNGYHRLSAQIASGAKIMWIFIIHECASEEELAALYATFDRNLKIRTDRQILDVYGAAEMLNVSKTTAARVYAAVPLIIANFDFARTAADPLVHRLVDLRMEKVKALAEPAQKWEAAVKKAPQHIKVRLSTQGALAVALTCFKHQPATADEFWGGIASNDGLRKGDARATYLLCLQTPGNGGTAYVVAMQAALAWNAWFEERDLTVLKINQAARFRLAGVPIKKDR